MNNPNEDTKLWILIEQASNWIDEFLGRKFVLAQRTEYYNGTGTQKLLLRNRPVYTTPTIQVAVDTSGHWGAASGSFASSTQLVYGDDFGLQIDQDDGTSRSAILVRFKDYWPKLFYRQGGFLSPFRGPCFGCIRVNYLAGYSVDTLPASFRFACANLIARMRNLMPLGAEIGSESYQERSISYLSGQKEYLLSESGIRPILNNYRNRTWG